jgi:tRNA pseudouridine38-40 synthase
VRIALGITYNGQPYQGWQSQSTGLTIQDKLEKALKEFTTQKVTTPVSYTHLTLPTN